jgi:hypothetical protein
MKATWNIINREKGKVQDKSNATQIISEGSSITKKR